MHPKPGPLMLDLEGLTASDSELETLKSPVVGGLILFSRNFESLEQLHALVTQIRQVAPNIIIAVDHEGGRVQRFRTGFTRLPPMSLLGVQYQDNPTYALKLSKDLGWLMAAELVSFDIDISFAPVLDMDYGVSEVIGDRAFANNPEAITELTQAFIQGMKEAGMASTGKHFPGHGAVEADSHTDIPIDTRSFDEIEKADLQIFQSLCKAGMDAVMPAHVIYPEVCAQPAGFSNIWLQDVLRRDLDFDGVIFSDDIGMEGASVAGDFIDRTKAGLDAGCDMILVCNNPSAAGQVKHYLEGAALPENNRLERMRCDHSKQMSFDALRATSRWQETYENIQQLIQSNSESSSSSHDAKQVGE